MFLFFAFQSLRTLLPIAVFTWSLRKAIRGAEALQQSKRLLLEFGLSRRRSEEPKSTRRGGVIPERQEGDSDDETDVEIMGQRWRASSLRVDPLVISDDDGDGYGSSDNDNQQARVPPPLRPPSTPAPSPMPQHRSSAALGVESDEDDGTTLPAPVSSTENETVGEEGDGDEGGEEHAGIKMTNETAIEMTRPAANAPRSPAVLKHSEFDGAHVL